MSAAAWLSGWLLSTTRCAAAAREFTWAAVSAPNARVSTTSSAPASRSRPGAVRVARPSRASGPVGRATAPVPPARRWAGTVPAGRSGVCAPGPFVRTGVATSHPLP